jgi:DNA-binding NarL/FixJ family response regulator
MDLDDRCERMEKLIEQADARISTLQDSLVLSQSSRRAPEARPARAARHPLDPRSRKIVELASAGLDVGEIAKQAGLGCAEVKLMLRLAGVESN